MDDEVLSKIRAMRNEIESLKKELRQSQRSSVLMYRKAGERCDQIEQHINMRYKPEQELPPDLLEAADGQEFFDGYEPRVIK